MLEGEVDIHMKTALLLTMALGTVSLVHGQGLVSLYNFEGTLDKSYDRDGFAQPLDFRAGRSSSVSIGASYSTTTVGSTTKQVANFSDPASSEQFFRATHGMGPNGGSTQYVNQYTILMDVRITSVGDWVSLFNTNANNANDGDLFIRTDDKLGISGQYAGLFPRNVWNRLAFAVDSTAGALTMKTYVNGVLQQTNALDGLDGRWSLFSTATATKTVDIFGDNDGDSGAGQISMLAFFDKTLSGAEIDALGGAGAAVPEPASMLILGLGAAHFLRRRRKA